MYRKIATVLIIFTSGCSNYNPYVESQANLIREGNPSVIKQTTHQESAIMHRALGEKYYSDRQYHLAVEQFSRMLEVAPGDAEAYEGLGRSHRELGEFDKAMEAFEKGIALMPPSQASPIYARLHNDKAVAYDMLGKHEEASVEYEKAIKLDPTNDLYYNNKGFSYLLQMRTEEATSAFRKALENNPNNKTAHANLGYAYGLKGIYELALKEFKLASDEASAYNNLGYIYIKDGKLTEAIESYNNALKIDPTISSSYYNKGRAYELLGEIDNAIQAYQEFLKYTNSSQTAEEAFNRLQALRKRN